MEQQEIQSDIAKFLYIYCDYIKTIFNNLPGSYEHYKCFYDAEEKNINIYELIDKCCLKRPLNGTRIELPTGTVYFCDPTLKWRVTSFAGHEPTDAMLNLAHSLTGLTSQASIIRSWEKRKSM